MKAIDLSEKLSPASCEGVTMSTQEANILSRELAIYEAMFRENRLAADRIAGGLTSMHFNWRPAPDQWSIAQCLVHLNISAAKYAERMDAAIQRGRSTGMLGSGPFEYGLISRWMLRAVDPVNRKKYKTPAAFVPSTAETHGIDDVLGAFHAAGARWQQLLRDADGLDLARVKVRSPALSLLQFSLGAAFAIQATHERRHLLQAEHVLTLQGR